MGHFALNTIGIAGIEKDVDIFIDDNKYKKDVSLPFDTKKILDSENIDTDQELGIIFVSPIHLRKVIAYKGLERDYYICTTGQVLQGRYDGK